MKTAVAKNGFSFPEKQKAKPVPQANDSAAHLYVGANIRLKGEIVGCDMMRVEGTFEGTAQARQLILCPGGNFLGTALIDDAEIEGAFEGTLQVRGRLFLRNKGRIRGVFSYGQLEIERGGTVEGKIIPFETKPAEVAAAVNKSVEPVLPKAASIASAVLAATPPAAPRPIQAQPPRSAVVQPLVQPPPKPVSGLNGSHPANPE